MPNFTIRFLKRSETCLAQRLLYKVYVELGRWTPLEENPTCWRIESDTSGEPILCDKFDGAAFWVGCFDGDQLVGCHRINQRKGGVGFDLEDYMDVPEFLLTSETAELTRLAIDPEYQKTHAMLSLLAFEYRYLKENGIQYYFTTAKFPQPGEMYCRMGMQLIEGPAFKFNEQEDDECRLLYFQFGAVECEVPAAKYLKLADKMAVRDQRGNTARTTIDRSARREIHAGSSA